MDAIQRQVTIAARRLTLERFVGLLAWCWFAALLVAAIAIAVPRLYLMQVDQMTWNISWLAGSLTAGLLVAAIIAFFTRHNRMDAAIEIDRRFNLKERVSSSLSLNQEEMQTEAGQALLHDATRRVERLDVGSQFRVRPRRQTILPLIPAAILGGVLFIPLPTQNQTSVASTATPEQIAKEVRENVKPLIKQLAEAEKKLAEKGLQDGSKLFRDMQDGLREAVKNPLKDPKEMLVKLNDLQKQVEEHQKKMGGDEKIREQLKNLKSTKTGPADKAMQAAKEGDFKKAAESIEELAKKIAEGKLDKKEQQKLQEQLADIKKNMQQAAAAHDAKKKELEEQLKQAEKQVQAQEDVEKQAKDLEKAGDKAGAEAMRKRAEQAAQSAENLRNQLNKMNNQQSQMEQLQQMAESMGQASQDLAQGKNAEAVKSLEELAQKLDEMQMKAEDLQMMEQTLEQIAECKGDCAGEGQGNGDKPDGGGDGEGDYKNKPDSLSNKQNSGTGKGIGNSPGGFGKKPNELKNAGFRDSNVKQKLTSGRSTIIGEAEGPNQRGQVQLEILQQVEAAKVENTEAISNQRLPRNQRDHAQQYFDSYSPRK
ncbi:MAG: hypothetical protein SGJ20_04640 [Planctomycetota bacterium]|nr:hypothetical protein [Planctomycetota bacterium]